ncbi:MAG: MMPL family transporter, partial [Deltaproteobacteria bacterium]|nr:MMPL family transporter [Deltaproteobacteria bacterium]
MLKFFYKYIVLKFPRLVLALLIMGMFYMGYQATRLEIDASAETLVLEDDKDLRISREINDRYETQDFLFITLTPKADLLDTSTLNDIRDLKTELEKLKWVESVTTILDVPLLESPPKPVKEMLKHVPTLETPGVDMGLAKNELLNSPIYRNLLVSPDFKTTAMQVNLYEDKAWNDFIKRRYRLREKQKDGSITPKETAELARLQVDFKFHRDRVRAKQHDNIEQVREVLEHHRDKGELFLGGVSMIADDLVTFIKDDLRYFGLGVLAFLIITLWVIFRQKRWIVLPVITCFFSVLTTSGLLGMFGWEVTVISSNFISLQIIITMAITIHLIVKYRELITANPEASQHELVLESVLSMATPCLFMVLTTVAGFCSLLLSNMLPVINFGWMMSAGIFVTLFLTFLIFPAVLILLPKEQPNMSFETRFRLTRFLANITERSGRGIIVASTVLLAVCVVGMLQLMVENSFISYFKESTEIYQGMKVIDQQLGGTTPLDIVLRFDEQGGGEPPAPQADASAADSPEDPEEEAAGDDFEEFDEFEAEFEAAKGKAQYWFTSYKMAQVERVHDYLEQIPEIGKIMSLGTMLKVGKTLNDGEPLDNFKLALIYNELPERFRKIILDPFVSVENNEVRYSIRVVDSDPNLRRDKLLKDIRHDLINKLELDEKNFNISGIMVLYNNMLQSLFSSQILTLGA